MATRSAMHIPCHELMIPTTSVLGPICSSMLLQLEASCSQFTWWATALTYSSSSHLTLVLPSATLASWLGIEEANTHGILYSTTIFWERPQAGALVSVEEVHVTAWDRLLSLCLWLHHQVIGIQRDLVRWDYQGSKNWRHLRAVTFLHCDTNLLHFARNFR